MYGLFIAVASLVAEQGPQGEQAAVGRGTRPGHCAPGALQHGFNSCGV